MIQQQNTVLLIIAKYKDTLLYTLWPWWAVPFCRLDQFVRLGSHDEIIFVQLRDQTCPSVFQVVT